MLDTTRRGRLLDLSAAMALRSGAAVRRALSRALAEVEVRFVEECVLQAHLFIGFPDVIEAMIELRSLTADPPAALEERDPASWAGDGRELCRRVYGSNYEKLRANVAALHPDLDRWMVQTGYGRVLARPGLSPVDRELCIVSLLVVWGARRQLHSHLRGALHVGASPDAVDAGVEAGCALLDPGNAAPARELWAAIRTRERRSNTDEDVS